MFWGKVGYGVVIRATLGGVESLLRSVMGFPPTGREDGTLEPVDSIDLIIVGLGLIVVLLVLLRR